MIAPSKQKESKKWLVGIGLLVVCGTAAIISLTINGLNRPVKGTSSSVILNASDSSDIAFDASPVTVNNAIISFNYPQAFHNDSVSSNDSQDLVAYHYKYFGTNTWLLSVVVERLSSSNLVSDSGYLYRTLHPEKYRTYTEIVNGQTFTIVADSSQSGFNQVAYTQYHGNLLGIIALNGYESGSDQNLNTTFNMLLDSFHWK